MAVLCRIVGGAIDLFLKMRHKGETTEIEHRLCVYLKLLFSEVFTLVGISFFQFWLVRENSNSQQYIY